MDMTAIVFFVIAVSSFAVGVFFGFVLGWRDALNTWREGEAQLDQLDSLPEDWRKEVPWLLN